MNAAYTQKEWISTVYTVFGIFEVLICEITKLSETNWRERQRKPGEGHSPGSSGLYIRAVLDYPA